MKKKLRALILTILVSMNVAYALAQDTRKPDTQPQPASATAINDDALATQEKILAELEKLRKVNTLLQDKLDLTQKNAKVYEQIVVAMQNQVTYLTKIIDTQSTYSGISEQKEGLYKQQLEILRLQIEDKDRQLKELKRSKFVNKLKDVGLFAALLFFAAK